MKASHLDQLSLLELQALDQRESALRHKRDAHPAHGVVAELAARAEDLQRAAISQAAVISDLAREIERVDSEIEKVRSRRARQRERIDTNQVPLRDISAMEHEIAQMDARLASLEDDELALEEKSEAAVAAREAMLVEGDAIRADVESAKEGFAADVAELDAELREVIGARRELAASLPEELLAEYEHVRRVNGALAVVEVRSGVGIGVAAEISPLELERIRLTPDDEVYWTDDTGAIVVRTTSA